MVIFLTRTHTPTHIHRYVVIAVANLVVMCVSIFLWTEVMSFTHTHTHTHNIYIYMYIHRKIDLPLDRGNAFLYVCMSVCLSSLALAAKSFICAEGYCLSFCMSVFRFMYARHVHIDLPLQGLMFAYLSV